MSMLRFDPYRGFENLQKKLSEIASEVEKGVSVEFGGFAPRVDISESNNTLFFYIELPGIMKENVKVSINDENLLIIKGNKLYPDKEAAAKENRIVVRSERNFGEFTRSFMLPDNINRESISAKFDNGVLEITLTKKEPEKPKEVEINIL